MNKKVLSIIAVIALILTVNTITQNGKERLTHMVIVQSMGIDENDGGFTVTLQYLDLTKSAGKNEDSSGVLTKTASESGKSIEKALHNTAMTFSDKLFLGQMKLIVININALEKSKNDLVNFFLKNTEIRDDALVVLGKSSAKSVIENSERGERVPAEAQCRHLLLSKSQKRCRLCTVNDFINLSSLNKSANIPVLISHKNYTVVER